MIAPPEIALSSKQWLIVARQVRETRATFCRLYSGLLVARTSWTVARLDPIIYDEALARATVAALSPDPLLYDAIEPEPKTGREARVLPWARHPRNKPRVRRDLTPDQWTYLDCEAGAIRVNFARLARKFAPTHPRLARRWLSAASALDRVWREIRPPVEVSAPGAALAMSAE